MAERTLALDQFLGGLTGPIIIGTGISTFLSGLALAQVYTYFYTFKTDRAIYRVSVIGLSILDVLHTILSQVTLWRWFVTQYANPSAVMMAPWSFAISPIMCGFAALVVQIFYAHRVYLLSNRSVMIPGLIIFGAFFQFVWAAATTGKVFIIKYFLGFQVWTYGVSCWLCGAAITDLLITGSLVKILLNSKRGNIVQTNNIINGLIALTVETNGITFTVAVFDLILFATSNDTSHVAPHLCLVKLYFNSYLVSLNCRVRLAGQFGGSKTIYDTCFDTTTTTGTGTSIHYNNNNQKSTTNEFEVLVHEKRRANNDSPISGIRVLTTASLSTELLTHHQHNNNFKVDTIKSQLSTSNSNNNLLRLDQINTFTTNIVGGLHSK